MPGSEKSKFMISDANQLTIADFGNVPLPDNGFREMSARYLPSATRRNAHRTDGGVS